MQRAVLSSLPDRLSDAVNQKYARPFVVTFAQNEKFETAASMLTAAADEKEAGTKRHRGLEDGNEQ